MRKTLSKSLTIGINKEDARIVAELRRAGVEISSLVRQAIREAYARRSRTKARSDPRSVSEYFAELYARYPTPPDEPPRNYNVQDRHEAREAILRMLNRKRT
jgi:hypothetical protein